jgi:GntR family transcriptional regulator of arabinose operon
MSVKTSANAVGRPPRYVEIEKVLRQRILSDYYSASGFLPQERELAQEFQVSRNTLRSALQRLSDQQLINKVQGYGTMVRRPIEKPGEYIVLHLGGSNLSSFVITILHEIDSQASQHSACIIYTPLTNLADDELAKLQQRLTQQRNLKGLLLIGNYTRALIRRLQSVFKIPMVLIGDLWQESERSDELVVSQVVGNDYAKMYQATSYLLRQGARRIAAIGQPRESIWGNAYYNGYKDAFSDVGIAFHSEYYESIDNYDNPRDVFQHNLNNYLQSLLRNRPHPDGLIFPAEYYGTVYWLAEENGISIPDDLLLVGRSAVECTRREFPCVTTDPQESIREAFDLLKQEQAHPGRVRQIRVVEPTWLEATPAE